VDSEFAHLVYQNIKADTLQVDINAVVARLGK